jgi:Xaa-Pro aminopeptidase
MVKKNGNLGVKITIMFASEIYQSRRSHLFDAMDTGLILIPGHVDSPMNYPSNTYLFRQNSSFLYFAGIDLPDLFLVMDIEERKTILFGNELTMDDIVWTGPMMSLKERASLSGITETRPLNSLYDFVRLTLQRGYKMHALPQFRLENKLQLCDLLDIKLHKLPTFYSVALIKAVVSLRSVKCSEELEQMIEAASIGYEMHLTAMKLAIPGNSEQLLAGKIEGIALSRGKGVSFPVILSQRGEVLHGHDHSGILRLGRFLLCDAGAESFEHYASDYTRTTPVGGRFDSRQRELYQVVLNANEYSLKHIHAGIPYRDIHLGACKVLSEGLVGLGILNGSLDEIVEAGAHALFMPHGLGHMLGLDVHDMEDLGEDLVGYDDEVIRSNQFGIKSLRLGKRLLPGFTLTVEPGLYFIPELIEQWESRNHLNHLINYPKARSFVGVGGIRLEDNVVVTENGCNLIGQRLPISPDEIETLF